MMNLAASLQPKKYPKKPKGKEYDCGSHGMLTVADMSRKSGVSKEAIRLRMKNGWRGADLLMPAHEMKRNIVRKAPRKHVVLAAVKIARAFPHGIPTVKQIMKVHPMGERNALRWRQAFFQCEADRSARL